MRFKLTLHPNCASILILIFRATVKTHSKCVTCENESKSKLNLSSMETVRKNPSSKNRSNVLSVTLRFWHFETSIFFSLFSLPIAFTNACACACDCVLRVTHCCVWLFLISDCCLWKEENIVFKLTPPPHSASIRRAREREKKAYTAASASMISFLCVSFVSVCECVCAENRKRRLQ